MDSLNLEEMIFSYVDKVKVLTSPQTWGNLLSDLSKNEIYVLLFLYRKGESTMTGIADYLVVPLNTATGIAARLEKKGLILRERSTSDKRIVAIRISEEGLGSIRDVIAEFMRIGGTVVSVLSPDELQSVLSAVNKLFEAFDRAEREKNEGEKEKRVRSIPIE